jgi:hypothetical protein
MGLALSMAPTASAQDKRAPSKGPIVLSDMLITGHSAMAVEVARLSPRFGRVELKRTLLSKVEEASLKEPF